MNRQVAVWLQGLVFLFGGLAVLPAQSVGRLSTAPDRGTPETEFTISIQAVDAVSYDLDYGDGTVERGIEAGSAGGAVVRRHRYPRPGNFTITARALQSSGELIELTVPLRILPARPPAVQAPAPEPPAADVQQERAPEPLPEPPAAEVQQEPAPEPRVEPAAAEGPAPGSGRTAWIVAVAALGVLAAAVAWWWLLAGAAVSPLRFRPRRDAGRARVAETPRMGEALVVRLQDRSGSARLGRPAMSAASALNAIRLRVVRDAGTQTMSGGMEGGSS